MYEPKFIRKYIRLYKGRWKIIEDDFVITQEMFEKYLSCRERGLGWIRLPKDYRKEL
jgi:hypothetical protein